MDNSNSCSECKSLGCGCNACKLNKPTDVPRYLKISDDVIMCPQCGSTHNFEDFVEEGNDYSYRSHLLFEKLKTRLITP